MCSLVLIRGYGMPESVGFIGLGVMGSALSSHLLDAGYEVIGYDVAPARLTEHQARGGAVAASPAEIGASTPIVVTSLPSARALRAAIEGEQGLAARPVPDLTIVETSTLAPDDKEAARRYLADRGAWLLDCTLSGTGAQARRKDVVAYVSGDETAKARAADVLRTMTRAQYDVGPFGNGTKMKIVANLLVAIHNLAAAEALLLAEHAGLDLATVLQAVGDGAGTSRMFEIRGPLMAEGDYTPAMVRTEIFAKDIDIIAAYAGQLRSPTPLFTQASLFYQAALAQGRGDEDTACVLAVLRQLGPSPA